MKDERIIAIRDKIFGVLAITNENFEAAGLIFESEKYRPSIPLFREAVRGGIKALLWLEFDDLPEDSVLVHSYHQSKISQQIQLDIGLDEILEKLERAEQKIQALPTGLSKESIDDLDICYRNIKTFLNKIKKVVRRTLITTQEIKKKRHLKKLAIGISTVIIAGLALALFIYYLVTRQYGLTAEYFADPNFTEVIETRRDSNIDFNWGRGRIIHDYFDHVTIRWTGKIRTTRNGIYTFITRSDDGARLWIDDRLVIDDWMIHGEEDRKEKMYLAKGYHRIKVEYFDDDESASMKLLWRKPGMKSEKVISPFYFKPNEESPKK